MTPTEIKEIQEFLDQSDMFLVEALYPKKSHELYDTIVQLQKEADVIGRSNNQEWLRKHREIQEVVYAVYRLKCEFEGVDREGHSIV